MRTYGLWRTDHLLRCADPQCREYIMPGELFGMQTRMQTKEVEESRIVCHRHGRYDRPDPNKDFLTWQLRYRTERTASLGQVLPGDQ